MEKIGLEAQLKDAVFTAAIDAYMKGIDKLNMANQKYVGSAAQINAASKGINTSLGDLAESYGDAGSGSEGFNIKSMALAVTLGNILANAITSVISKLKEMVSAGIMSAARVEEMDVVLQLIGGRAGYTAEQLDEMVASIVKLGIQTDVAQNTLQQFIRYNMKLEDASKLARVAQDAAVIGMIDSSQALDRLIWGIQRYDTQILQGIGINIRSDDAFRAYADTLHKTAAELTENEKQQAFLNAVLLEGKRNAGIYEASMKTAGKQLRSISRETWELARIMGEPFLSAFSTVIKTIRELIAKFTEAFKEGGAFYNTMIQLGAAASILADYISIVSKKFADWFINLAQGKDLLTFIEDAIANLSPQVMATVAAIGALVGAFVALKVVIAVGGMLLSVANTISFIGFAVKFFLTNLNLIVPVIATLFSKAFPFLAMAISRVGTAFVSLAAVIDAPLLAIIIAVAAVIAIIVALATNVGGARDKLVTFFKQIGDMAAKAAEWIGKAFTDIANWVADAAVKAWNWGVNLVTNFANGIINAASSVLNSAMEYLGNILSWWLSPGSPPKIAPDLVKWGIGAVNEWLKGFTQGDFDIIKGIQAPLKQVFDYLESIGKIGEGTAGQMFADLSKQMIEATKTGKDYQNIVAQIISQTGVFGPELGKLTQQYFQLAGVLADVTSREKALADAQKRQSDANKNTNKLVREYNQMLRSGASKADLAAKLKAIDASKAEEMAASKKVKKEEDALKVSQDSVNTLKEQIKLQEQLVSMLLQLAEAQTKRAEPEKATKAGGVKAGIGAGGIPEVKLPDIQSAISIAIDNAKKLLLRRLGDIWQGLKDKWNRFWFDVEMFLRTTWRKIVVWGTVTWQNFTYWIYDTWQSIKLKAIEIWGGIKQWFSDTWNDIKLKAVEIWGGIKQWFIDAWNGIKLKAIEIWTGIKEWVLDLLRKWFASMGIDFDEYVERWKKIWENIKLIVVTIWNRIKEHVSEKIVAIRQWIQDKLDEIKTKWEDIWNKVSTKATEIWNAIYTFISDKTAGIRDWIRDRVDEIKTKWDTFWNGIKTKVEEVWNGPDGIKAKIEAAVNSVKNFFTNAEGTGLFDIIGTMAADVWNKAVEIGTNLLSGIKQGIINAAGSLLKGVTGVVESVLKIIMNLLGIGSESKVLKQYGKFVMQGFGSGIQKNANIPQKAMTDAIANAISPVIRLPQSVINTVNRTATINMGGVTVNNGMDVAAFRGVIKSVLREEMGGI